MGPNQNKTHIEGPNLNPFITKFFNLDLFELILPNPGGVEFRFHDIVYYICNFALLMRNFL